MKLITVNKLEHINYNTIFVNALKQFWHTTKYFQCIGAPKKQNLFLYLDGCKITYTDKNGNTLTAQSGDIVYTPIGSEYKAQLSDFERPDSHTVGINFFLLDEHGDQLLLSNDILIFTNRQNQALPLLFHRAITVNTPSTQSRMLLMEILSTLSSDMSQAAPPISIAKGVSYLSEHIEDNPTVSELAAMCGISEVYFRKQFKKHTGTTPHEYRNTLRLDKARSYLEYGDISVQEISDTLGYSSVSHFIKEFKKQYGFSPLKYRKLYCAASDT